MRFLICVVKIPKGSVFYNKHRRAQFFLKPEIYKSIRASFAAILDFKGN